MPGEGTGAWIVDNAAITVAGCPVSFVNEGYLFAGWKDESDNDVAVGSAVASDMILTAQWVINPCPDRKSLSKIVLTSATEGNVTGNNNNEYAGGKIINNLSNSSENKNTYDFGEGEVTGYKLADSKSAIMATLSKGFFQTGDEVVVGITKANDRRTISDSKAIMTIYAGSDKDNTIELGTLTNVDKAGYYTYALTEADITAINAAGYKSVGLFRASENGQNHYVYSVEITGCREWSVFHTLTFKNEGGTVTIAEKTLAEGDYANSVAPAAPKIFGYHFKGWSEEIGGELVDLATYTPTEDKILYAVYEEVVCPTSGTIFAFQMKTDLTNGNVFASAPKAELMTTENYLSTLQGGEVEVSITGTNNNRVQFYDNKAIGFANGTGGQIAIDMDCAIQTGDVLRFINYASSGNKITLSDGTNILTLDGNKEETIQEIVFTEAWNGAYKLTLVRANNTPKLTYFEIYRRPVLTGVTLSDITIREGASTIPTMTLSPSDDARVTSQEWSILSGDDKITINATTGEVTGVAQGDAEIKVVLNGDPAISATATVHVVESFVQQDVDEPIVWDFSKAGVVSSAFSEQVLANVDGVTLDASLFEATKLVGTAQNISDTYFQGTMLTFNTTKAGLLSVRFTNGNANVRTLKVYVGDPEVEIASWSYSNAAVENKFIEVPAGKVTLRSYQETSPNNVRIMNLEFLVPDYTRDNLNPTNIATICLPNGGIMTGATLYKMAGKNEYNKLCFDEVQDNIMVAGNPYLFVPENGNTKINVYYTDKLNATAGSDNGLYGTYVRLSTVDDGQNSLLWGKYIISNNKYIYVDANNCNLAANRAYVVLNEVQPLQEQNPAPGLRRIVLGTNESQVATGVDQVQGDEVPTKMIINGQLFILRGEKMYDAQGKLVK
jgi:hypothetical protein